MNGSRSAPGGFFKDADYDYEARIVLGAAASGLGDAGLVLATLDRVADGDPQSWFDAWTATAADLAARGDTALGRGHQHTASWAFLAAAEYYAKALVFVDGLADQSVLLPTFREHRSCWEKVVDASQGRFVRVAVPYEGTRLPGYLLRPDDTGAARPTLVVTNGSDGSLPGLVGYGAAEVLHRGWNAFLFDGPGQQSMLFERSVPFRHDWEAVLTPVIDALVARPDVDFSALTGYGISQGGYWITRAVAFERRLVAAVADPGVVDVSAGWTAHLPPALLTLLDSGQKDGFNAAMAKAQASADPKVARTMAFRSKPYGMTDPFDLFTEVRRYQVRDVAGQITTPLLVLNPDDEHFFPGQPRELYDLLPGEKEIIGFTQAQGANFHCQPTGRQLTHTQMLDWLADHLPPRQGRQAPAPAANVAGGLFLPSDRRDYNRLLLSDRVMVERTAERFWPSGRSGGGPPRAPVPHRARRVPAQVIGQEWKIWNAHVVMPSDPRASSDRDGVPRVNRLLALSDGVIAIALTLLVLQLRVPSVSEVADPDSAADLAAQLGKGSAQLVSYGISFYVIAQFWLVHRQVFRLVRDQEDGLEWWNFAFLLTISVMPFTSTLLGDFVGNPLAVDIFAANLLIASMATQAMIVVGRRKGLLVSAARARAQRISAAVVPVVMAVSIGLSWWSTSAAMYSWILIAVAPVVIDRWSGRQARVHSSDIPGAAGSRPR